MSNTIQIIPFSRLIIAFLPVVVVIGISYKWALNFKGALYAVFRMLVQLLLIGYFLNYIFDARDSFIVCLVLTVMLFSASWISLGAVTDKLPKLNNNRLHNKRVLYLRALLSILIGGGVTLMLVIKGVLNISPFFSPRYIIPIAGMIFANSMNSVSLAAERFFSASISGARYERARDEAFNASLIPITNSLFAVGLVSIPGMMTGQILSGVSPVIAAKYQIMVMCMIYGASGISSACFIRFMRLLCYPAQ